MFFGLLCIPQYMYDWGYSNAYIELMCTDTTIYDMRSKKSAKDRKYTKADADEAMRVFNERRNNNGKTTVGFEGFQPVKLSEHLKQ